MTELKRKAGRGLLMVMIDVDPTHLAEFTQWYETEHLVDRQKFPGMLTARRYVNVEGGPREFLARYDMTSPNIMSTRDYKKIITTPWTEWVKKYFPRPGVRLLCRELGSKAASGKVDKKNMQRTDTRGLFVAVVEVIPASQKSFQSWVEKICLPAAQSCRGVFSARFFKETGGKDGRFVLLYDLESERIAASPQFKKLPGIDPAFCSAPPQQFIYKEITPKIA